MLRQAHRQILNLKKGHHHIIRNISGEAQELRIPVPYGHIAGKAWGDPSGKPILGLHGWLDNAGTFDHLAPLINEGYYLVSVDQAGHGLTSKFPTGMQYNVRWIYIHQKVTGPSQMGQSIHHGSLHGRRSGSMVQCHVS